VRDVASFAGKVGFGRKRVAMPVQDGEPSDEIQIDVGWLTTIHTADPIHPRIVDGFLARRLRVTRPVATMNGASCPERLQDTLHATQGARSPSSSRRT
jgi:hypothetical protein